MTTPKHRADRPVDACSLLVAEFARQPNDAPCFPPHGSCGDYPPRHRAPDDSRRARKDGGR